MLLMLLLIYYYLFSDSIIFLKLNNFIQIRFFTKYKKFNIQIFYLITFYPQYCGYVGKWQKFATIQQILEG